MFIISFSNKLFCTIFVSSVILFSPITYFWKLKCMFKNYLTVYLRFNSVEVYGDNVITVIVFYLYTFYWK